MLDVNMMIANQYSESTEKGNKKQIDLAEGIGVSRQTMSKIMNGARAINAIELHKISEYLHGSDGNPHENAGTSGRHKCYPCFHGAG